MQGANITDWRYAWKCKWDEIKLKQNRTNEWGTDHYMMDLIRIKFC